jgi:hypothetical protein
VRLVDRSDAKALRPRRRHETGVQGGQRLEHHHARRHPTEVALHQPLLPYHDLEAGADREAGDQ